MATNVLRVRAKGTALVSDYEAMEAGVRRYIGRKLDTSTVDAAAGVGIGFRPTDAAVEVPVTGEYVRHVQHGDLWAADAETAERCGVAFDPTFGGSVDPKNQTPKSSKE